VKGVLGSSELLRFHGVPALLNQIGVFEVFIEGVESFTWSYGGVYEVKVNGGGLVSEDPLEPSREVSVNVNVFNIEKVVSGIAGFTGYSGQLGLFNLLGWRPLAPLLLEGDLGLSGCARIEDIVATPVELEPLHGKHVVSCSRPRLSSEKLDVKLGVFKLNVEGDVGKLGSLVFVKGGGFILAGLPGTLTLKSDGYMEITIEHPYRDYNVSLMHVLSFYKFKGDGLFRGVSAVVEGPRGSLAIASPESFELIAYRGLLELKFKGELSLALGSYIEASRLLLERSTKWDVLDIPSKPLGHVRSYRVQPILTLFKDGIARFEIMNPTMVDGVFEIKTYYPLLEARLSTLGGWIEMKASRDSITIPSPRGYYGLAEIRIGRA